MSNTKSIRLVGDVQRRHACNQVMGAPELYVVTIAEETRSQAQNRHMWPLIQDMQRQSEEMAVYSAEDVKLRFLNALGKEMRFLPELEGGGMFPVGQRSSTLSKRQFAGLLELMFAWGARHGIKWSVKSQETFAEYNTSLAA